MTTELIPAEQLGQLRSVAENFKAAYASKQLRPAHEDFNVFTTLLKEDDEVRLHTRFIHCMLSPEGAHGFDFRFLKLFIETLEELPVKCHDDSVMPLNLPAPDKCWSVRKEANCTPFGQIDLLLEKGDFGIAIENKLNAAEQERQLECYADYLQECYGERSLLFYLTKDGKRSFTHAGRAYYRISYQQHVLRWLEKCVSVASSVPPVEHALKQYQDVVRRLLGRTSEAETMTDISNFIAQETDLLRYRVQIKSALDQARAQFLNRIAEGIMLRLKDEFRFEVRPELPGFGMHSEGTLILEPGANSPLQSLPVKVYVQHWAEDQSLLVGVETDPVLGEAQGRILKHMDEFLGKHSTRKSYHKHRATKSWPTGWHNLISSFNDSYIADHMKGPMDDVIDSACDGIREHVRLLEDACRNASVAVTCPT